MSSIKSPNYYYYSSFFLPPLLQRHHRLLCSRLRGHRGLCVARFRAYSAEGSGSLSGTFMEVVKAVLKQCSSAGERAAIRAEQKSYSFAQIITSAVDISKLLLDIDAETVHEEALSGQRVGIVAKPSPEFVAGILGTWLCGRVAVPLAPIYPEAELLHVMEDSDISMILSTTEHQELMGHVATKCSAKISLIPAVRNMIQNDNPHEHLEDEVIAMVGKLMKEIENLKQPQGDEPALILYTSGTTGKPKGVVHTHRSIISQTQILMEAWEYSCHDQFLHCLPLHHVHGLFNALFAPLYAGAVVEFMPKFSVRGVWQRWCESYPKDGSKADDAITLFTGVPTMYTRLLQGYESMDPDLQAVSASAANKLRLMMCGSSALPYPILKQWKDVTGHVLLERYGMTEFVMALSNPLHGIRKRGTVGKPLPLVEVKIVSENNNAIHSKCVGELCVRSPSLFKEYWKKPEVTKESFIDGGFFKTGDTVTMDEDGYYVILGRTNADIMKVGGYKLSALEIESVLLEHETVSECCVLGMPDTDYGEVVCAIIVPQEDAKKKSKRDLKPAMTLEKLRTWSKEKLAPYKIPTKLFLWDSLPRNAMGKVNKKELRRLLESS